MELLINRVIELAHVPEFHFFNLTKSSAKMYHSLCIVSIVSFKILFVGSYPHSFQQNKPRLKAKNAGRSV